MSNKTVSQLHKQGHADYTEAVRDIHQAIGDISKEQIFGRQVLCAVYVRPSGTTKMEDGKPVLKPDGTPVVTYVPASAQDEDVWQGKALLVLKLGPNAFQGDESYLRATFPPVLGEDGKPVLDDKGAEIIDVPKVGDWLFARPNDGVPMSIMGDGAKRPQGEDYKGNPVDKFEWDGWPCRILQDESFFGKMSTPNKIV